MICSMPSLPAINMAALDSMIAMMGIEAPRRRLVGLETENSAYLRCDLAFVERFEGFEESGIVDWREAFLL